MGTNWIKVAVFTVAVVVLFGWAGELVTRASGGASGAVLSEGVSVEIGEEVFWGPGKCHTCHSVGSRGNRVRGPNLGATEERAEIGVRAGERARERATKLSREMLATDYLIESIADPSAYVVEGYKDEMPKVYEPPISLTPDQVSSVILYLQSLGGTPDPGAISLPPEIRQAGTRRGGLEPWQPYLDGDSVRGRQIFFDLDGPAPCAKCHRVQEEGGDVGPELTAVAGTRTAQFIVESVLEPSNEIASGYETILVQTAGGLLLDGVVRRQSEDSLWLANSEGAEFGLARSDIARQRIQELSLMPGNFAEVLSVKDLHDVLAYLLTLR